VDDGTDHPSRGVAGRYWRGELGLSRLLWKPVAAAAVVMAACLGLAVASGLFPPKPAFFLGIAAWTAALAAAAWLCLGLFRSGMTHGRRGGQALGYGVAALAGVAVIVVAAKGPGLVRASLGPAFARVQESLPSTVIIQPIQSGTELVLDGYFDNGSAKALREAAAQYPAVTRIRLGGVGGELRESRWIRDFIAERAWDTYTSTECWSGCAIAYLGGVRRTIGPGARLGFIRRASGPWATKRRSGRSTNRSPGR